MDLMSEVAYKSIDCTTATELYAGDISLRTLCNDYHTYTTRPFNLADLEGPLPIRAAQMGGSHADMVEGWDYIIENDYHPKIALPKQVTELEPIWASCYPFGESGTTFSTPKEQGIWDPPIRLDSVASLAPISITVHGGQGAHATTTALPGLLPARPNSPMTKQTVSAADFARETEVAKPFDVLGQPNAPGSANLPKPINSPGSFNSPGFANSPGSGDLPGAGVSQTRGGSPSKPNLLGSPPGNPTKVSPTAVFMMGSTEVTASAFADPDSLQFGTQILRNGGPAVTLDGQVISFGPGGHLQIGTQTFNVPVPTKVLQSDGKMTDSWIFPNSPKPTGADGKSGSASIYQIDDPTGLVGGGILTPSSRRDESSSVAATSTKTTKKKSGAERLFNDSVIRTALLSTIALFACSVCI